ncbi:MAG TPA: hypothetical protein VGE26_06795 [Sphingobacteriaceae bacterium]
MDTVRGIIMGLERLKFSSEQLFNHYRKGLFWGIIISEDRDWYEVLLTHRITGPVTIPKGKKIHVRKSFLLNHIYYPV